MIEARPNKVIALSELHPDALVRVVTDLHKSEFAFTNGNDLRINWEGNKTQRIGPYSTLKVPPEVHLLACPDGSFLMVSFSSEVQRLGDEIPTAGNKTQTQKNMSTKKLPVQPAKKLPPKPAAAGKAPVAPPKAAATKAAPVKAPSKAAPVAAPKAAKPAKPPKDKVEGNTKWLLLRLKAQGLENLTDEATRPTIREGLKQCETYLEVVAFLQRSGIEEAKIQEFLNTFFDHKILLKPRKPKA